MKKAALYALIAVGALALTYFAFQWRAAQTARLKELQEPVVTDADRQCRIVGQINHEREVCETLEEARARIKAERAAAKAKAEAAEAEAAEAERLQPECERINEKLKCSLCTLTAEEKAIGNKCLQIALKDRSGRP
jgi:sRNA-binding protein